MLGVCGVAHGCVYLRKHIMDIYIYIHHIIHMQFIHYIYMIIYVYCTCSLHVSVSAHPTPSDESWF